MTNRSASPATAALRALAATDPSEALYRAEEELPLAEFLAFAEWLTAATAAPAPATDEQLVAAIDRGLAVGTLVAFEDVDWDDLTGDETGPDHADLIEQLDAERALHDVVTAAAEQPLAERAAERLVEIARNGEGYLAACAVLDGALTAARAGCVAAGVLDDALARGFEEGLGARARAVIEAVRAHDAERR